MLVFRNLIRFLFFDVYVFFFVMFFSVWYRYIWFLFVGFKDFLGESIVVLGNIRKLKLLISMVWFIGFLFFGLFFFKDMVVYLIFNSFWLGFNLVKFFGG